MITGFIVLLTCQLVGEFVVRTLDAPLPRPVLGMVLLLIVLMIRRPSRDDGVVRAADALLRHLQLLFVPAGVGIVHACRDWPTRWLPVTAGLVLSWPAVLLVTAGTGFGTLRLAARFKRDRGGLPGGAVNLQFAQAWAAVVGSPLFGITLTLAVYQAAQKAVAADPRELAGQPGAGGHRHRRRCPADLSDPVRRLLERAQCGGWRSEWHRMASARAGRCRTTLIAGASPPPLRRRTTRGAGQDRILTVRTDRRRFSPYRRSMR